MGSLIYRAIGVNRLPSPGVQVRVRFRSARLELVKVRRLHARQSDPRHRVHSLGVQAVAGSDTDRTPGLGDQEHPYSLSARRVERCGDS